MAGATWRRSSIATTARSSAGSSRFEAGRGRPNTPLRRPAWHASGPCVLQRPTPVIRSDNGLIFTARRFRAACRDYRLSQEFITPYTPEQNGVTRALLPQSQGRVRLAAQLRRLRRGKGDDQPVDPLVQRGSSPSGTRLPEPASVPGSATTGGGLRWGEHYSLVLPLWTPFLGPRGPDPRVSERAGRFQGQDRDGWRLRRALNGE